MYMQCPYHAFCLCVLFVQGCGWECGGTVEGVWGCMCVGGVCLGPGASNFAVVWDLG